MSKIIKINPAFIDQCRLDFDSYLERYKAGFLEYLAKGEFKDGKITYSNPFTTADKKATLYFKETAWLKMQALVREFDKEVAWHGLAFRGDDPKKNEYTITDILIYPQEVTGATVSTDQTKYQNWLMSQPDEVFNNIRMQGHSHVNMSTMPSGVDTNLYDQLLAQLDDDMFYIFLIWNKRGEKTIKIYDMASNTLFETADVSVKILADELGIEAFMADAKEKVETKTYTATVNKPEQKNATSESTKISDILGKRGKEDKNQNNKEDKKDEKPDVKKEKKKTKVDGSDFHRSYYDDIYRQVLGYTDPYDEDDDPYSAFGVYTGRYSR